MRHTSETDQKRTLRAKLSHPDVGHVGDGNLTFGYGCAAMFSFNGFAPEVRPTRPQLAEGLVAEAEDGTKWSLFGCTGHGHALLIDFVAEHGMQAARIQKFEVRYSDVSDWFFPQMQMDERLGVSLEWKSMPAKLAAEVSQPDLNFKCESYYDASLVQRGEDRILHQHFEFHFTATQARFTLVEVRSIAHKFSQLLSLLLAHPCSILSIEVSPDGVYGGRLYYGVSKSPTLPPQTTSDPSYVGWRAFFTSKDDFDGCWDSVVKKFFQSKHRDVVWARLAGMQNFEGFWEYRILGYVALLDGYVSMAVEKGFPVGPATKKLKRLESALKAINPTLTPLQRSDVVAAVVTVFSSTDSFESKFDKLVATLDKDVIRIINFKSHDFKTIKELRNGVAHALEISYKSSDLTSMLSITHRLVLLLTYLFFLDVGVGPDIFLRSLDRTRSELRLQADIDKVHLDRKLRPETFFVVSPGALDVIKARPRRLFCPCFVVDEQGGISYSLDYSQRLQDAMTAQTGGHAYERLGLPSQAVRYVSEAHFEDGARTESVHSAVMINRSLLPT